MEPISILVTLDANYLHPLKVMLYSLFINTPNQPFDIYIIHANLTDSELSKIDILATAYQSTIHPIVVNPELFQEAPTFRHYTISMYYRLLAYKILPESIDKILYLDPDILVINTITPLWQIDVSDFLFAAAIHTQITNITNRINEIRLQTYETPGYYNSGVMLLNLKKQRAELDPTEVFTYIKEHIQELILPDQDVLNGLYGTAIYPIDDSIYNYDVRHFETYFLTSTGTKDLEWIIQNTVILHYCGKNKPWKKTTNTKFSSLYKHYEHKMQLLTNKKE